MYCPNCGKEVSADAKFCPYCGGVMGKKVLDPKTSAESEHSQEGMINQEAEKGSSRRHKILRDMVIILGVMVFIIGFMIASNKKDTPTANTSQQAAQVMSVKSSDMIEDYIRDQGTAEQKYKGKTVKVSGKVIKKDQFQNSTDYYIVLEDRKATGRRYSLDLKIPQDQVSLVNKLKVGENAVAEGVCQGVVKQDNPTWIDVQIKAKKINH